MSHSSGSAASPSSAASFSSAAALRAASATRAQSAMSLRAISSPIPREAPVTIAVRTATDFTRVLSGVREPEEFVSRFRIFAEGAPQRRRDRLRVLLLYAAHHHAEMVGLDDDSTSPGPQDITDRFRNLVCESLLH